MFLKFERVKKSSFLKLALFNLVLVLMFSMNPAGVMAATELDLGKTSFSFSYDQPVELVYKNDKDPVRNSELITFITYPSHSDLTIYDSHNNKIYDVLKTSSGLSYGEDFMYTIKPEADAEYHLFYTHNGFGRVDIGAIEVTSANLYLLEEGISCNADQRLWTTFFKFTPEYSGKYEFSIDLTSQCCSDLDFHVVDENFDGVYSYDDTLFPEKPVSIFLNAGSTYYLQIVDKRAHVGGHINAEIECVDAFLLNEHELKLTCGEEYDLGWSIYGMDPTMPTLDILGTANDSGLWTFSSMSENSDVAFVDGKKLKANGYGTTTITTKAKLNRNGLGVCHDTCKVTVEHFYKKNVVAPDCTNKGYVEFACACGDSRIDEYMEALGHDWEGTVVAVAGPTVDGKMKYTCSTCGETKTEKIPALGGTIPAFTDVPSGIWYYDSVYDLVGRGIINGMTDTTYAPQDNITRGQFAKILAAASGDNTKGYDGKVVFDDCNGHWADEYINWAYDKGIVKGMSETSFAPNNNISRQEMAVMIMRYADYKGIELPKVKAPIAFNDKADIATWSADAVSAMQQAGIINGKPGNLFDPKGNATRAEAAKMISEFLKLV